MKKLAGKIAALGLAAATMLAFSVPANAATGYFTGTG